MRKRFVRQALCVLLACILAVPTVLFAFAGTPAEDAHLHFDDDGHFRILNFSDIQDDASLNSSAKAFLSRAVYAALPDLIVLTGDNIYGPDIDNSSDTRPAIAQFMDVFESLGVPVAIIFGNHDDDTGTILNRGKPLSKEQQMAIYNSYSVDISYDEGSSMAGCGTYNIPIYGSTQTDKVKFNLWMFDTGSDGPSATSYDGMRQNQIDWYVQKSNELSEENNNGKPVPSIAFQHIIVPEIYNALKEVPSGTSGAVYYSSKYYTLPDNAAPGSILGEKPCPSASSRYHGEFAAARSQGDIRAIVCGHDHTNMFVVPYQGIDLICTPSCGFYNEFGYSGDPVSRGARVIDIDEQTGNYSTYMINLSESTQPEYSVSGDTTKYVKDVAVCYAQSAQCGSRENAVTQAYNRVYEAVDAANGNGVAIREDLNAGNTADLNSNNHYAVCMGYTLTEDPAEAIRGFGLYVGSSNSLSTHYDGSFTNDGVVWLGCGIGMRAIPGSDGAVNLNIGTSGNPIYFYASYDSAAGNPITELRIVNTGDEVISMSSYSGYNLAYSVFDHYNDPLYSDLNRSASGDYIYALYRSELSNAVNTQINTNSLRTACLDALKRLREYPVQYTSESRNALLDAVRHARNDILRDLDRDHQTWIYNQSAINAQAAAVRAAANALSRGKMTLTFNPNGGTCSVQTRDYELGVPLGALPNAVWSRYAITGWYTEPEGGTLISEDTIFTDSGSMTVYAHWTLDGFWIPGDADQDGVCSLLDVAFIMRYLVGYRYENNQRDPDFDHSDVNMDGVLNLRDVALIRRFLAGGWGVVLH